VFRHSRLPIILFAALILTACNQAPDRSSATGSTGSSKASASTHFTMVLTGPRLDGEQTISIPVDQISGAIYTSFLGLLYSSGFKPGEPLVGMTLTMERPVISTGTYDFAEENIKMTLASSDTDLTVESESGTLTLTTYSENDRKASGTVDGQFRSTNRPEEVYTVKGSFAVER
jgi:hypothetical protein